MVPISPKQLDFHVSEPFQTPSGTHPIDLEALSWRLIRSFGSSRRLSAWFDFWFLPAKLQEKSCRQSTHRSRRQSPAAPPSRPMNRLFFHHLPHRPQQPERGRHQFDPSLFAAFCRQTIELTAHHSQFLLFESDGVFNAESFPIDRAGLPWSWCSPSPGVWRRNRFRFRDSEDPCPGSCRSSIDNTGSTSDKQQPERARISRLSIHLVLDDLIQSQWLSCPTRLPHIIPSATFDPAPSRQFPRLYQICLRLARWLIQFDSRPQLRRSAESAIALCGYVKTTIVPQSTKSRNALGNHRFQQWPHRVLRIDRQHSAGRPSVRRDKGLDLRRAEAGWALFRCHPGDFKRKGPGTFPYSLRKNRVADARLHPFHAVDIADLNGLRLPTAMVGGVENANRPPSQLVLPWRGRMRSQPRQPLGSKFEQPVVGGDLFSKCAGSPTQPLIEAVMVIGEQGGPGDLDRRCRSRSDGESVDHIEQNRALGRKTSGDSSPEIKYTLCGGVFAFHTTSILLEDASWGGQAASPLLFVQTRDMRLSD